MKPGRFSHRLHGVLLLGAIFVSRILSGQAGDVGKDGDNRGDGLKARVACIGDSITYGAGIQAREANSYPAVLGRLLGSSSEVRNFGVNGATLLRKGDKPYWKEDAFEQATAFAPHHVVIHLGTNDSKPQNWKHEAEFIADLASLVDHFRAIPTRPRIWLCKPVPVYEDRWGIVGATVKGEIARRIEAVALDRRLAVIDLHSALSGMPGLFPDGVHPNARGAERLVRAVHEALTANRPAPQNNSALADRPNFIIMLADDMGWNDSGVYGHPRIRTPRLDRLAREGLVFQRAFLTTSSCSPSRCSILTGRYSHSTGGSELHQPLPAGQLTFVEFLGAKGYYTASAGKWHLGETAESRFDKVYKGGGPSGCENWLVALRERPRDRPFFLWLAAIDAHRPYKRDALSRPHGPEDAVVPPFLPDLPETRRDLALYYDEVSRLDGHVGAVLDELDAQGASRDTFVLFLSDNGRPFPRCKTTLYDSGIRTPFIVRWPARVKPGTSTESLVSSVDIAPTLLQLAGISSPLTLQGLSFAPVLTDPGIATRKYVFAGRHWHDYSAHQRAVRSPQYLYIWNVYPDVPNTPPADAVRSPTYRAMIRLLGVGRLGHLMMDCFIQPRPIEELYDLEKDPHSLRNLAGERSTMSVLMEMRQALHDWIETTGDFIPAKRREDEFDRSTGRRLKASERS